jgi:hypothetical protein
LFNFEEELAKYNLTQERYEQLLKDCSNKIQKISDDDWSEICDRYGLKFNPDTIRKGTQPPLIGSVFVSEYYKWKESQTNNEDDYLNALRLEKEEIFKERKLLSDQRRLYNRELTFNARSEHLMDKLVESANRLNQEKPLIFNEKWFPSNIHKEAVMFWSDWHYGMITDNIWNKFNTEICKKRVKTFVEISKEFIKLNNIDVLDVVMLGDSAHGSIHSTCRVQSEENTCDQLMHVSEIMAEALNDLSKVVNHITLYSCYGNHMKTIQNKNESIHSDNMERIVPWWIEQRLQNNKKIEVAYSEYKEFTKLNVLGKNICCVHGDLERDFKNIGVTINTLFSRKFGETIDYTISGDKHHLEEFEKFDIESILVRSLCGADEYSNNGRLYSRPGQTLMIFNDVYGREATYNIPLDII